MNYHPSYAVKRSSPRLQENEYGTFNILALASFKSRCLFQIVGIASGDPASQVTYLRHNGQGTLNPREDVSFRQAYIYTSIVNR